MTAEETVILDDAETIQRFWDKIVIPNPGDPNACYDWIAMKDKDGCGKIAIRQEPGKWKNKRAPRLMWILENDKDIPEGMQVLHTCDNESCTNPKHLKLGTVLDNMRDRMASEGYKTVPKGEYHKFAKLTTSEVIKICKMYFQRNINVKDIAKKYKITTAAVSNIIRGKNWKHISLKFVQQYPTFQQRRETRNKEIMSLYNAGAKPREIAKKFKLSNETTRSIIFYLRNKNNNAKTK